MNQSSINEPTNESSNTAATGGSTAVRTARVFFDITSGMGSEAMANGIEVPFEHISFTPGIGILIGKNLYPWTQVLNVDLSQADNAELTRLGVRLYPNGVS